MIAGNAAVFRVSVEAPPGWSNFDTVLNGDDRQNLIAVGVRFIDTGLMGYIPPNGNLVTVAANNRVSAMYGLVMNPDTESTRVIIELAIATDRTDEGGQKTLLSGEATIGGVDVGRMDFNVLKNVRRTNHRDDLL